MSAVRLRDLVVRRDGRTLAGPVSFDMERGATLGLRGPSGSGKSTTLRALVGLLPPELEVSGEVRVLGCDVGAAGADLPALRARAVLVGQTPVVFPTSILANAAFGLRHVVRASRDELRARALAALREAGLWDEVADRLDTPAERWPWIPSCFSSTSPPALSTPRPDRRSRKRSPTSGAAPCSSCPTTATSWPACAGTSSTSPRSLWPWTSASCNGH
jgi:ABC-type glutathione transport system ATPase component